MESRSNLSVMQIDIERPKGAHDKDSEPKIGL